MNISVKSVPYSRMVERLGMIRYSIRMGDYGAESEKPTWIYAFSHHRDMLEDLSKYPRATIIKPYNKLMFLKHPRTQT